MYINITPIFDIALNMYHVIVNNTNYHFLYYFFIDILTLNIVSVW